MLLWYSDVNITAFLRKPTGVTVEELERVFHQQIWRQFLEYMKGKPNIASNRAQAYCQLTSTFPEGLFHGYSYPDLTKGEDYTLESLSGKRGETGSISVNESDGGDDNQDILDLGSGVGSDCDDEEGDLESQVFPCCFRMVSLLHSFFLVPPPSHPAAGRVIGQHALS